MQQRRSWATGLSSAYVASCDRNLTMPEYVYESIIGNGLRARSPAGQGSEVVLGCEILNRMTDLGRPVSYRIGR